MLHIYFLITRKLIIVIQVLREAKKNLCSSNDEYAVINIVQLRFLFLSA